MTANIMDLREFYPIKYLYYNLLYTVYYGCLSNFLSIVQGVIKKLKKQKLLLIKTLDLYKNYLMSQNK